MDAIEMLHRRVSAGVLGEPAPDDLDLHALMKAATRAPDHGRLRPWRFIVIRDAARARFAEVLARAYSDRNPNAQPAQLDKERTKPMRAPMIIVVVAHVRAASNIPVIEQVLSAGAAAQNIMLAAFAMGYGCAWKTGEAAYDTSVKAALGLAPIDVIVGFLYLGTNSSPLRDAPELDAEAFVREWSEPVTGS
jgi:nitroreductase